jgi:NADPH:quinone reductase-like Zn-dependent oxidoreductase
MVALKAQPPGKAGVETVPLPKLRPDYILVRVRAVALNPTDWKHITFVDAPVTIGCDFAGDVVEVGKGVTKAWEKGDRVCGFVHGANVVQTEDGAFGEYLVAKADVQMRIPDSLSYEEAATLGVGIFTIGQGLYDSMHLPWPDEIKKRHEKKWILIYGGSTATGALAIQWATL